MKMQNVKGVLSIALMSLLTLSIVLASVPMANAAGAITLTPSTQKPGGSVTVFGYGFGALKRVGIGFGAEAKVINEDMAITGPFGVGTGPYVGYLSHLPIKPGTFSMYINTSAGLWLKVADDAGNGTLTTSVPGFVNGTIDYVTGKYTRYLLNPVTVHRIHLCNYTTYEYDVTPPTRLTTSDTGSFQTTITIPSVYNGNYFVTAIDTQGNLATATLNTIPEGLTIGVMLILSTSAVIVSTRYLRRRLRREDLSQVKL